LQRSTEPKRNKSGRKSQTSIKEKPIAPSSSPHRHPLPLLLLPQTLFFLPWAKRETATSNILTTTKQGESFFKLEKHNPWPQNPRIQECTTRSTYYNSHAMKTRQRNITVQKKPKKKESNTSRIVIKTTAEGSNLQTIWHTRFEAKVQNYAQKTSFRSKLKLLVHLRAC
jgi:hypothetical protein